LPETAGCRALTPAVIGGLLIAHPDDDEDTLLDRADQAVYAAERDWRGEVHVIA
jgi:predicted signal transduction protein with EAL and GGDEF domain